jgi:hypothetical protein
VESYENQAGSRFKSARLRRSLLFVFAFHTNDFIGVAPVSPRDSMRPSNSILPGEKRSVPCRMELIGLESTQ